MNRHFKLLLIIIFIVLLIIGCTKQKRVERKIENGVEVLINPLEPFKSQEGMSTFKLIEDFRIDTEDNFYAEIGLSEITTFALDSEGNIFLLNPRRSDFFIFKFDNSGNYIKCFGRKGQGPGEIQRAFFICVDADDRIVTTDLATVKVVFFDNNGGLSDEISLPPQMSAVLPLL